jgi:hypothetical protein
VGFERQPPLRSFFFFAGIALPPTVARALIPTSDDVRITGHHALRRVRPQYKRYKRSYTCDSSGPSGSLPSVSFYCLLVKDKAKQQEQKNPHKLLHQRLLRLPQSYILNAGGRLDESDLSLIVATYLSLGTADQVPFFLLWYDQSNIEVNPCVASEVQFSELCT